MPLGFGFGMTEREKRDRREMRLFLRMFKEKNVLISQMKVRKGCDREMALGLRMF